MKMLKYFFQFLFTYTFFIICRIIGYKNSSNFGAFFSKLVGPYIRSKKIINNNLNKAFPNLDEKGLKKFNQSIWKNYGRILADYSFIKDFRNSKLDEFIDIEGDEIISNIKKSGKPVIFISGHFNNFELLALILEKSGVNLSAIYRPLNNIFLNKIMVNLRKNYICKNQIPKGMPGMKLLLNLFKQGSSIALMIDQRVSQGIKVKLFNDYAYTTTIPAQFIKKYNCDVVPLHIERYDNYYFKVIVDKPITYTKNDSIEFITQSLNNWLEKKILIKPDQWIWTHNRWK
jgi:Kdo2-lipid IVA lauroyltransferase/acyltransferase